ncbi:MAG: hypothetical protein ACTSSK_09260 [Candidatus Heimdallarchaeota archaeon]
MRATHHQEKKKNEPLLYSAGKPGRGTAFDILTDGTIIIHRKLTLTCIHIPVRIHNWMDMVKSSKGNKNTIRITIIGNEEKQSNTIINNQIATLEKKTNGWFLELSNMNEMIKRFSQYKDSKITCIVKWFTTNKTVLQKQRIT